MNTIPTELTGYFQYLPPQKYNNNQTHTMDSHEYFNNMPSSPTSSSSLNYLNGLINNNVYSSSSNGQDLMTSNNSTSDDDHQHNSMVIDERKQRRMISNRESARRSRMRKQRHLDELWSQVIRLRGDNHFLIDKLNHVSESHEIALMENAKLKEETCDLRQLISEIRSNNEYDNTFLRELEDSLSNSS